MTSRRKYLMIGILLVTCIGCDQTTKHMAQSSLETAAPQSLFNDVLRLQYTENPGGMLSFGAGMPASVRFWFLTVFVGLLLVGILAYMFVSQQISPFQTTGLSFIVGGGSSNLLDRILHDGHVIDFLNIGIGTVRTAIFNLADVMILFGAALLLLSSTHKNQPQDDGAHQD